ncbi:MAG: cell wall-binding repeat-containing protein [Solirubrobacterales bacterium]
MRQLSTSPGRMLTCLLAFCALSVLAACGSSTPEERAEKAPSPAPPVVDTGSGGEDEQAAEKLGFPAFATKNTTRVGGRDAIADAAGVALAVHPSAGGVQGPRQIVLVDSKRWQAALAASVFVADPVGAPVLMTDGDDVPDATDDAIKALAPRGGGKGGRAQALTIGSVSAPKGLRTRQIRGDGPAAQAAAIDKLQSELAGKTGTRIMVVSQDSAAYAMPAAAWAARSGHTILFTKKNSVPKPTLDAIARRKKARLYVLGPTAAVSKKVEDQLKQANGVSKVKRIGGRNPVASAIAFARYQESGFGWGIVDPGHGFVIANVSRPADAAASAPLAASGKFGPLLVTDAAARLPAELQDYLLDVRPGYETDPTRAVYNHVWILGDVRSIGIGVQAQIDELAEVTKVEEGKGPEPAEEPEPEARAGRDRTTTSKDSDDPGGNVPRDEDLLDELEDALRRSPNR